MRTAALAALLFCAALRAQDTWGAEKERVLGNHLAADLRREMPPLPNAALDDYVRSVVQRLGAVGYSYELLDSSRKPDVTEPMPLPGGRILIPSAAFLAAADEAEFAALLAHAAGHLAAGHATRAMKSPGHPEVIPLLYPGSLHQDSRGRAVAMIPTALRSMQDERERGADARAIEILTRAGYDASALHSYLRRTLKAGEAFTAPRLASLPSHSTGSGTVTTSAFIGAQEALRALQHPPSSTRARREAPTLRRSPEGRAVP